MMEWDNNQDHHHHHYHHQQQDHQSQRDNVNGGGGGGAAGAGGVMYVKVMTDEQLETLRKQIAVYATICEQLVEMHKTLTAHQDLAGGRLGNIYCDSLMTSGGPKITARQRWTPTPVQLQILERIFDQGNGTPSKQKIKEITSELSQHGQISETNVYELRRKLNELESSGFAETTFKVEPVEPEIVDIEDYAEAYIRDLLVASGLYHGSSDKTLSRWDPLAKPISKSVYEEVEECYRKLDKDNESSTKDQNEKKIDIDHITLFDLLNEALSVVLGPPVSLSRFRRKIIGSSMLPPLKGRKLLDCVWEILREYLYPSTDISNHSLDNMVAHDLQCTPWCGLMDEEINDLGREVEGLVIGELVDDIVKDMQL